MDDTKNPGSALELIQTQHDQIEQLIAKLESTDDADERTWVFQELADDLAAHAEMEEKLFYPWVHTQATERLVLESAEEHLAIKRVLADMIDLDVGDPIFDAKLTVLKEEVRHHARDEEEGQLFPKVRAMASEEQLDALGAEMLSFFEDAIERDPRNKVHTETGWAAPV
jgi:hemerythrin superfamily protein